MITRSENDEDHDPGMTGFTERAMTLLFRERDFA